MNVAENHNYMKTETNQTQGQSKLGKIISDRKKLVAKTHALEYVLFLLYYC